MAASNVFGSLHHGPEVFRIGFSRHAATARIKPPFGAHFSIKSRQYADTFAGAAVIIIELGTLPMMQQLFPITFLTSAVSVR
jgi:hypothetical protein